MKNKFITAYIAQYGTTKKEATRIYNECIRDGRTGFISAIIECYQDQCRKAFYND